ncbi:MAG: AMP-binding protein [Prolixibacteraceae bacterium]
MNKETSDNSLTGLYRNAFLQNPDLKAFSDYEGSSYTYGEAAGLIGRIHQFFEQGNIMPGDKIALLGRNSSNWAIAFLAIVSYGAVAVPVLPDFNPVDMHHIVNHSESRFIFLADAFLDKLNLSELPGLDGAASLSGMSRVFMKTTGLADAWDHTAGTGGKSSEPLQLKPIPMEQLCVISYTSGTSGFTKGVMLSAGSLYSNLVFAREHMPLKAGDRIVSFLPMAHVFGLLFEFLFPATVGCHITFLTKAPTPPVIVKAFKEVKPRLILSVPLVIEKIYKKQILPKIETPVMQVLLKIPGVATIIRRKVREKLVETFGGDFFEIVIGGAALNSEVESFFRKLNFPFTIGYGMTECGPLISYDGAKSTRPFSAGKLVDRMQVRIDSPDPYHQVGEILVKGDNVMLGYYKNEEATRQAIDDDGWLHTGDLGVIDHDHYIYIKGRCKNMLLGPSGQNIYPEEIEIKLSNLPFVAECVVVEREAKLVGLVFADAEGMQEHKIGPERLLEIMEANLRAVNKDLPKYSQLSRIELVNSEFEKTPKRNIKRYKYL